MIISPHCPHCTKQPGERKNKHERFLYVDVHVRFMPYVDKLAWTPGFVLVKQTQVTINHTFEDWIKMNMEKSMNDNELVSWRLAWAKLWRKCGVSWEHFWHTSLLSLPASEVGFAALLGPILEMDCQVNTEEIHSAQEQRWGSVCWQAVTCALEVLESHTGAKWNLAGPTWQACSLIQISA